ncbi:MAG: hypothetical protein BGO55_01240 [Sphingobacteriales bacterium 50-39]|nr:hypothetical protein [Sphingobacteriales bacterium]OJW53735.1 MAG: hypothetical protein BGO55_01240 [Sphingobacteriales bacterium 50-39]
MFSKPSKIRTLSALAALQLNGYCTGSKIVTYVWTQVSGPYAAAISDAGNPSTMVKGLVEGRYVFQLVVTDDKGLSGVDTTSIVVNPSPIKTLTLQPAHNPTECTVGIVGGVNQSGLSDKNFPALAWTSNSQLLLQGD